MGLDPNGLEREPFDGTWTALPTRTPRRPAPRGHGPRCSTNPEVGCRCQASLDDAARERGAPYAARDAQGRVL